MRNLSLALVTLAFLGGCASIESSSDSSAGIFESIASPFESSSESSGSGNADEVQASYRLDVQAFTVTYLRDPGEEGELARGLSRVAEVHGINDWEADSDTLLAVEAALDSVAVDSDTRARVEEELEALRRDG